MNPQPACESCQGFGVVAEWHNYAGGDGDNLERTCRRCNGTGVARGPRRRPAASAPRREGDGDG